MWSTRRLTDEDEILAFLRQDEVYAAYAIGDLEPEMFALSTFVGALHDGHLRAIVLHFRGLPVPALVLLGEPAGVRAVLDEELRPQRVYLTLRARHRVPVETHYTWERMVPMWRMALRPETFLPTGDVCTRLDLGHAEALANLYSLGGADAFTPSQLDRGVFCGAVRGSTLIAAAGTHLVSDTYLVAAMGNVFVHPDHRRRGLGRAVTASVVRELLERGIRLVVLNVAQENRVAIGMYEGLGFQRNCAFFECPVAVARNPQVSGTRA